jgi:hypothetical protein
MATENVVEKYKKALEAAEAIKAKAVEDLMAEINAKIEELNSFGYGYRLVEGDGQKKAKKPVSSAPKHCTICDVDGHDARSHRNQDPKKKFTQKELQERGLV